jgi:ubiquinone/menaquinone biosynthesis C-methylase UbiE
MPANTDRQWRKWGETDPYFGVITFPEFRAHRIAENLDSFFQMGRRDIARILQDIKRLYGDLPTSRALDFGSGVGRFVLPLAKHFDHIVGVDISEAMISEARRNCAKAGVHNVEFVISDDTLSAVDGSFDLVLSYNVLQHVPVDRGLVLTSRMLALLRPGGFAVLHYSIKRTMPPLKALGYAIRNNLPLGGILWNLLRLRRWDTPDMQMNNYPLGEIVRTFEESGLGDIFIVPEWHSTALTARVYGRRAKLP